MDHLDTALGPSDEEGEIEAKRQKSEPTTPISTSSRHPNEYDAVMGITQVDPRKAARFEEGVEPEFLDAVEEAPKVSDNVSENRSDTVHTSSASHGGCGSALLQECLNTLNQVRSNSLAPCHSGVDIDAKSDPPRFLTSLGA